MTKNNAIECADRLRDNACSPGDKTAASYNAAGGIGKPRHINMGI